MKRNSFLTSLKNKNNNNNNTLEEKQKFVIKLLENKELNKTDNFDGLSVKFYKESIKEKIEKLKNINTNKGKNILIDKPFPLISIISQRKILNKSNVLVPKIMVSYRNKLNKIDEQLIKSGNYKTVNNEVQTDNYKLKKIFKKNKHRRNIKSTDNKSFKNLINFWNKTNYKLHDYRRIHDSNYYNKIYFKKDPMINYDRNSYKIKKLLNNDIFINKIKEDVSSLKFCNDLKANLDYHYI